VFGGDNYFYSDADAYDILDRLPANLTAPNYTNMTAPPKPYLAWTPTDDNAAFN